MRVERQGDVAVVRYHAWKLALVFGAAAAVSLIRTAGLLLGAVDLKPGQDLQHQLIGGTIALVLFAIGTVVCYEDNTFTFDLAKRVLAWRTNRLLRRQQGTMPLADVESVVIERGPTMSTSSSSTHRLVLVTKQGKIPLSNAYLGTLDSVNQQLAAEIQELIGKPADVDEASLREMVRAGRKIDAIAYARQRYGFSLEDAHNLVESIQSEQAKT
jgi:hypothetical protein